MTEHTLISENRESVEITAVTDVSSFDENSVFIVLTEGALSIRGKSLRIIALDLETGRAVIGGEIASLEYIQSSRGQSGGLLKKLLK